MNAKTSEHDSLESQQNKLNNVLSSENHFQNTTSQLYFTPAVLCTPTPSLFTLDNGSKRVTPVNEMRSSVTHSYVTDTTLWRKYGIGNSHQLPYRKAKCPKKVDKIKTDQHEEAVNKETKTRLLYVLLIFLLANIMCAGVYRIAVDSAHLQNQYHRQNELEKLPDKSELMKLEIKHHPQCKILVHETNQLKQELQKLKAELNVLKNDVVDIQNIAVKRDNHVDILAEILGPDVDYALEINGGRIVSTLDTITYGYQYISISLFGTKLFSFGAKSPYVTIQGGLLQPGDCWAFKGKDGKLSIELARKIYVTAVTIEHLPQAYLVQESIKAAPRHFTVYGIFSDCCTKVMLGQFEYLSDGHYRQTFYININKVPELTKQKTQLIEFHFSSNHGNPEYTCVYRIKIHGEESYTITS